MKNTLIEDIMMCLADYEELDTQKIQQELYILMDKYEVKEKETALTVWKEDENAMLLKKFIIAKTVKGCTERTIGYYRTEIWKILNSIGKNVSEITTDDIRVYLALRQRRDKVTNTTADNELRCLRTFFGYLHTEELIPRNPAAKVERIKGVKRKKHAFSEIEIEKIRYACRNELDTAIIEVLLSTGMRVSELISLKIEDINDDSIYIKGKGNKYRMVYLNAKANMALHMYLSKRNDSSPYVFPGGKTITEWEKNVRREKVVRWYEHEEFIDLNKAMDKGSVETRVRRIGKLANVDGVHPHRFRRTCATMALRRGMPIEQVSMMLGHEQISTTQIYLDLAEDDLKSAHKKYIV